MKKFLFAALALASALSLAGIEKVRVGTLVADMYVVIDVTDVVSEEYVDERIGVLSNQVVVLSNQVVVLSNSVASAASTGYVDEKISVVENQITVLSNSVESAASTEYVDTEVAKVSSQVSNLSNKVDNISSVWTPGTGTGSATINGAGLIETNRATGSYSVAHGAGSLSEGLYSHAEGSQTTAIGTSSHSEGFNTLAVGTWSHAEGNNTTAAGESSHAAGLRAVTSASGFGRSAENGHNNAYAWSGINDGTYYHSHGDGTFNVNPVSGINGFYVGDVCLADHIRAGSIIRDEVTGSEYVLSVSNGVVVVRPKDIFSIFGYQDSPEESYFVTGDFKREKLIEFGIRRTSSSWIKFPTYVKFGNGVTDINNFDYDPYLSAIVIPPSVTNISISAFEGCENLSSVVLSEGVERLCNDAFDGCLALKSITLPNSLVYIDQNVFTTTGLTTITVPPAVVSIGRSAFCDCQNLVSASLPASLTFLGQDAFSLCPKLESITFNGKTKSQVTSLPNYPWDVPSTCTFISTADGQSWNP